MTLNPVLLTEDAAREIKLIMQSDEIPDDHCLRIGVKEGGCGTGGFTIGFDINREDDIIYTHRGITIYVNKKHLMYVLGMEVRFKEEGDSWGFVFEKQKK